MPPPLRAANWDWPSECEFEARFSRWPSEAWSLGVLIGDQILIDGDSGQRTIARPRGPGCAAARAGTDSFGDPESRPPVAVVITSGRLQEPILSEEPFSPGELELQHHRTSERRFHVQSVAAPRRLTGRRLAGLGLRADDPRRGVRTGKSQLRDRRERAERGMGRFRRRAILAPAGSIRDSIAKPSWQTPATRRASWPATWRDGSAVLDFWTTQATAWKIDGAGAAGGACSRCSRSRSGRSRAFLLRSVARRGSARFRNAQYLRGSGTH